MKKIKAVIGTYLDASTAHVTNYDCGLLDDAFVTKSGTFIVYKYEEGYFVHVDPLPDNNMFENARAEGYSEDFLTLVQIAHAKNCWFLRLDSDGTVYPELPTHTW